MMYLLLLLITPVLSLSYDKARLYDAIDCTMISKLRNTTIVSNDYVFLTGEDQYIFIDKTIYNIMFPISFNNSYCYEKKELTLHYDCDKYTKFTFHSTLQTIDNFIDNIKIIDKFNVTNNTIYINNNTNSCSYKYNGKQDYYGLYFFLILWLVIFKCC
jgi:hypothetical protein